MQPNTYLSAISYYREKKQPIPPDLLNYEKQYYDNLDPNMTHERRTIMSFCAGDVNKVIEMLWVELNYYEKLKEKLNGNQNSKNNGQ